MIIRVFCEDCTWYRDIVTEVTPAISSALIVVTALVEPHRGMSPEVGRSAMMGRRAASLVCVASPSEPRFGHAATSPGDRSSAMSRTRRPSAGTLTDLHRRFQRVREVRFDSLDVRVVAQPIQRLGRDLRREAIHDVAVLVLQRESEVGAQLLRQARGDLPVVTEYDDVLVRNGLRAFACG